MWCRHAQAGQVVIELRRRNTLLELNIRDDGRGFDVTAALERAMAGHSLGILSLQERAALFDGEVKIISTPGRGTEVRAVFPLGHTENGA